MTAIPASLRRAVEDFHDWLFSRALPLWWDRGGDRRGGGFFEQLDQSGAVVEAPRRTRLVGRQIFAYATAARLGWPGPARAIVAHGLAFLLDRSLSPAGTFHGSVSVDGTPVRSDFDLYDHAFALFGLAAAVPVAEDPERLRRVARDVRDAMIAGWKHPMGGFEEAVPRRLPLGANPHMHIFEACLAWLDVAPDAGDAGWGRLADEIAELCLARFLHPDNGALREFFDGEWRPMPGAAGRVVEPGHQFEWGWLLLRWARPRGRDDAVAAARRLIAIGEDHGVDPVRGVAMNQLDDGLAVVDADARLWPQTERIKAWLAMAEIAESDDARMAAFEKAAAAVRGLMTFFATDVPGLWHETMSADGRFVAAPARASSLYHITCAYAELHGATADRR